MTDSGINERILKGIRENSAGDATVTKLLLDLVYKEADHPGWWKDLYKEAIKRYSEKREDTNED